MNLFPKVNILNKYKINTCYLLYVIITNINKIILNLFDIYIFNINHFLKNGKVLIKWN